MFDILSITGVIFVLVAVGYGAVRFGLFSNSEAAVLGKFVVTLALPALIFRAVTSRPLTEIAEPGYLLAVLTGSLAVFAIGYVGSRRIGGAAPVTATFRAMGISCANSGFIGYPVLLIALPDVAAVALALNMIVENLVMIPLTLALAESARAGQGRVALRIASRLIRNPVVIALLAGLVVSLSGLRLPAVIVRSVDLMAMASAALSLVAIGGTLAALPLRSFGASAVPVVLGKLVLHPLAVWVAMMAVPLLGLGVSDPRLASAAVIMAATPAMAIYPILAQHYGAGRQAALSLLLMTVLSFATLSAVIALVLPGVI
ncbi:AEC family transporter [Rhodobacterales bacterium HKCCE2091]|nr:AEC family transporter [Rhodobacterales bacterium HKCCE2091]